MCRATPPVTLPRLTVILRLRGQLSRNARSLPAMMMSLGTRIARLFLHPFHPAGPLLERAVTEMRFFWAKLRGRLRQLQLLRKYTITLIFDESTGVFTVNYCRNE
jgi:hypothetical protein